MLTRRQFSSALIVASVLAVAGNGIQGPVKAEGACVMSDATIAKDETAIRGVLTMYNAALNSGSTAAVLPLYTEDGIFMAPYSPSFIGEAAIRQGYDIVFHELKFDVKFNIAEVHVVAPSWAFVRTNSAGTTLHHATGKTTSEANQELFIFHKDPDGKWRIARYSFSPIHPPGA